MKNAAKRISYLCYALWTAAALTVTAAYSFIYAPSQHALADRWAQTARANADARRALQTLGDARRVEDARSHLRSFLRHVGQRDGAQTMASLLRSISAQGKRCGVAIATIEESEPPKKADGGKSEFEGTAVTFEVRGSFAATLSFLTAIGVSQPMVDVGAVAMTDPPRSDERGYVESRIRATVYRFSGDALKAFL